jgi:two-component system phosphate regulon sensor histidine kinase PhoR
LFGIEPSDALGKSLIEVTRHHTFVELWRKCRVTGEPQTSTLETIPGHLIVQGTASVLGSTIPGGILLVFVDLTRIRKLEVVRRDFFSNVSHELRTPLASLKVIVETLQEGGLEDIPTARRFLEKMDIEIDNLIQMVREILELNRIESGRVPLNQQKVSPRVLVESAVGRMQPQAERAGINMVVDYQDPLSDVEVDANRIEQVLINLIHNAIKFTAPGGKITIRVRQVSGMVEFTIEDTGAGIREEDLPRIFERFYKIDPSRAGGGTGLGLSIARHTVEAHGGRIWAESEYQKGSRFLFVLPAVVM